MAFPTTYTDLQTRVIAKARLDATLDANFAKDSINIAYAELVLETEFLAGTGTLTLTPGTASYDLTTVAAGAIGRVKAIKATSGGVTSGALQRVSLEEILKLRESNTSTASPTAVYALLGYKTLELFPAPASADTLTVYYVGLPTALSAAGDIPILGEPYGSRAIEYGALVQAGEFKADPQAADWERKYSFYQAKLLAHLGRRRGGQPDDLAWWPVGVYPPHDPSTDVRIGG